MDLLPEINVAPSYQPEKTALLPEALRTELDTYLETRGPASVLANLKPRVLLPQHENILTGTKYNVPLLNAMVFYVGIKVSASCCQLGFRPPLKLYHLMMLQVAHWPSLACIDFLYRYKRGVDC